MNQQRQGLASAVMERDRSRSRMRMVTVTVGAASLATAGVVAYNLPGSAHTTAVSGTTTPAAQPSAAGQRPGDDAAGTGAAGRSRCPAAPSARPRPRPPPAAPDR